jgi:hypothetical protein
MDSRIIVLGLGADPRIYADTDAHVALILAIDEPLVLHYREQAIERDSMLWVLELLFELDLIELVFELVFWLLS